MSDPINSATFVAFALQSKRIEHLDLVPPLEVKSAIPPALTPGRRLIGQAELNMQAMIPEQLDALGSLHKEMILGHPARLETLGRGTFE